MQLMSYFSTYTNLGTGYDIHLLCTTIADHVTLLDIFVLNYDINVGIVLLSTNGLSFTDKGPVNPIQTGGGVRRHTD